MMHSWERKSERLCLVNTKWRTNQKLESLWMQAIFSEIKLRRLLAKVWFFLT
jgi:hypothetical protein